ncbi:MAG: TraB/GumN family protein [Bacteroidota bacterium]
MIKYPVVALGLWLLLGYTSVSAQSSLLWKIEGEGLDVPSYLYGTIHLLCKDDLQLPPPLQEAFTMAGQLVLELDMDDPSMFATMQQVMVMQDGGDLESLMEEEEYNRLQQFFQDSIGMGLGLLGRFKPIILQTFMYPKLLGCTPVSYEEEFVRWAKKTDIEVHGLETIEFQMGVFDEIPYEQQAEWLLEAIANYQDTRAGLTGLMEVYHTQDLDALISTMESSMDEYGAFRETLLDDRNATWLPKMVEYMQAQSTFFGVGAGHLGGEQGLLSLLREAGYTVSPVEL